MNERKRKKYRNIFLNHDKVVLLCDEMLHLFQKDLDLPHDQFVVMPNPIDVDYIHRQAEHDQIDRELQPYILQVARLVKGKGHEQLLDIYAQLKANGRVKHKLILIGDGENRSHLEKQIQQLNLEQDCLLLGEQTHPYPYFQAADLFVHTSEHEGLPLVILESLACGVPVVAMDCPTGPADILGRNHEYGILVQLHDTAGFVNAVEHLLGNTEAYHQYQQAALKRIEYFSFDATHNRLRNLLGLSDD